MRSDKLLEALRAAAKAEVLPRYRRLSAAEVRAKSRPDDLVTAADTGAEAMISRLLAQSWPEARVLGEESIARQPELRDQITAPGWSVVLDPVDGTWNFAHGLGVFGMIAVILRDGVAVHGILYDPLQDDWIEAGQGGAAELVDAAGQRRKLQTAGPKPKAELHGFVPLALYPPHLRRAAALASLGLGRVNSLMCSCHEYRMLAQGHVDFVLTGPQPETWDHAAGAVITRAAGGVARSLTGEDYVPNQPGPVLFAASEALWADLAQTFACLVD